MILRPRPRTGAGYLEGRFGRQAVQLMTVPRDGRMDNGKVEREGLFDSYTRCTNQKHTTSAKLRAILRAPEVIQELYREGLVSQATAARMGPRSPQPEQAARVAEARQARATCRGDATIFPGHLRAGGREI
jgi:hypothetical protein